VRFSEIYQDWRRQPSAVALAPVSVRI
jgi:hypothetical protein